MRNIGEIIANLLPFVAIYAEICNIDSEMLPHTSEIIP